jgi:DNA-binding transcriptional ArsR family regulator
MDDLTAQKGKNYKVKENSMRKLKRGSECRLNERQNLVSHHLTIMKKCGIIEAYSSSKWRFYRLNPEFGSVLKIISQIPTKKE